MQLPTKHQVGTLASILLVYVIPVALIHLGVVPFRFRFAVLAVLTGVAVILSLVKGYSRERLGVGWPSLLPTLIWLLVPALAVLFVATAGLIPPSAGAGQSATFYAFFVLVSAPAQEFLFRSVLISELESLGQTGNWQRVLISAGLYAAMHTIYLDWTVVIVTFVAGILWGSLFLRYRNVVMVAMSHALVGALAIAIGLV